MNQITFEFYGRLEHLAGLQQYCLHLDLPVTLQAALSTLSQHKPEIQDNLERCACAIGDHLVHRDLLLQQDTRIALLPPVAGG